MARSQIRSSFKDGDYFSLVQFMGSTVFKADSLLLLIIVTGKIKFSL